MDQFYQSTDRSNWINGLEVVRTGSLFEVDWRARSKKENLELKPNILYCRDPNFRKSHGVKYFIMDKEDTSKICAKFGSTVMTPELLARVFGSLTSCVKEVGKQILYIRVLTSLADYSMKVFCDEALEVIQILLQKKEKGIGFSDKQKWEKYRKKWTPAHDFLHKTILLTQFLAILDEFGCDKTPVKFHADSVLSSLTKASAVKGEGILTTWSHDACSVTDIPNALTRNVCEMIYSDPNGYGGKNSTMGGLEKMEKETLLKTPFPEL